ncbi:hypothetical protein [Spirosoma sp. KNUC1025]|uniref:hypothetical protein n=1 Tax=Spirosoma sp. KNUC1025 TaxID=2894082 RepID=UPI00386F7E7E|nr:hypothetical protein LN737_27045 [Spirosoma sp. KNUC1025]
MTPEKRLNQLEPIVAETAQKVDRLIETNGQILDVAVRGNANAELAAKGTANLTVSLNEFKQEVRDGLKQIDQKIDTEIGGLRQEMNQRFDQLIALVQDRLK